MTRIRFMVVLLALLLSLAADPPLSGAASGSDAPLPVGLEQASGEEALLAQARSELWAGRETAAVPLLRQYLGRRPDDREARLDLARALAWSGRLRESMQTYRGLDSGHPDDADVLSGMGDLLSWSGRSHEALALYRRALVIDPDRETTRSSATRLMHHEGMVLVGGSEHFRDSGRTLAHRTFMEINPGESSRGGPVARILRETISSGADGAGPSLYNHGAAAGWDRLLAGGFRGRSLLGATRTGREEALMWSETRLSLRTLCRLSIDLAHSYRDRGHELSSVEARRSGLTGHELNLSGYRSFSAESGLYASARGGSLSDGNAYRGCDFAYDFTVLKRTDARVFSRTRTILSFYAKDFKGASELYYAAQEEWAAAAGLRITLYEDQHLSLDTSARGGGSGNKTGNGEILGAGIVAAWTVSPASAIEGGFSYDQSIRTATYIRRVWFLGLRWKA